MTPSDDLQARCELGQEQLMRMEYLSAEQTLVEAEQLAIEQKNFDTLGRLYMPLQEARRQRRQRCGEGAVHWHLSAPGPFQLDAEALIERFPKGQFLVAGWGTIEPAVRFRQLQSERRLYVETYLGAIYPAEDGPRVVVIVPTPDVQLPPPIPRPMDELIPLLPAHSIVMSEFDLPVPIEQGTAESYAYTMALWERLHMPFLAAADSEVDPLRKIEMYRETIQVDYACELAHQRLSDTARRYARGERC